MHHIRTLEGDVKLPIEYDPTDHLTAEDAAKALYEALKPVVAAYGQNPERELFIFDPDTAAGREYGRTWVVTWEAGPFEWGTVASAWMDNAPKWYTEPHFSFDLCFQEGM